MCYYYKIQICNYIATIGDMVLICIPEKNCIQFIDFSYNISSLNLQKVWINTVGGI